ncbi:MAG TPA: CbiX/SirB N-terminal domain-containing protein [Dietzia timorensis]|uniref:CbiX/SirB N-terminal domain-containing protein n=1 Tax=Dietzia timorensis TaxID=499555 RepID=A0A921F2Y5_9ACTN|nr:CbiX/SirB N-terminal domain-containing protein [Dietzia timorensis]HJE90315.1 CbiX/SirB N-terminal domain-containing protein [Dietzia timorensis]
MITAGFAAPTAVVAWHGTRNLEGRADTERLTSLLGARLAGVRVVAGFVDEDVQAPALSDVLTAELASTSAEVVVIPAFIAAGYHVGHDIGAAAQVATRGDRGQLNRIRVTPHLGRDLRDQRGAPESRLVNAILASASTAPGADSDGDAAGLAGARNLVLASAGSSFESVGVEIERLRAAVAERYFEGEVRHAVLNASFDVNKREICVPLLLARGFFAGRARGAGGAQAPLLGDEPAVDHIIEALAERFLDAAEERQ